MQQWRLAECERWEKLWKEQCPSFVWALHVVELRNLVVEYLLSNQWRETDGATLETVCAERWWRSTASNRFTLNAANSLTLISNWRPAIVGEYCCDITVPHIAIDIDPPSSTQYCIGFWNPRTKHKWVVVQQFTYCHTGWNSRDIIYFAAGPKPNDLKHSAALVAPNCIEFHLHEEEDHRNPLKLTIYAHINASLATCTTMELDESRWNDLHLFIECSWTSPSTSTFQIDYLTKKNPKIKKC